MPTSDAFISAGLTFRQLDHWTAKGYLFERNNPHRAQGSGVRRVWAQHELDVAKRILLLLEAGLVLEKAARIARLEGAGPHELTPGVTLLVGV